MLEKLKRKNINKEEKQIPINIEQLIEYYGLEKIWEFIDEIIDYLKNLKIEETTGDTTNYYKEYKNTYIATGNNVTVVPIGITDYRSEVDLLFVQINGLHLVEGTEYIKDGNNIILAKGIDINTPVHFVALRSVAATTSDYSLLKGDTGIGIPKGGEQGQVLAKTNDADYNTEWVNIFNKIYPVGAIYMSATDVNPSVLFGGTWERIKDTFLLAAGDVYANGTTGGEATHTLTENEMPSHKHKNFVGQTDGTGTYSNNLPQSAWTNKNYWNYYETDAVGGGQPHNNMPPYLAVYVWKRTA